MTIGHDPGSDWRHVPSSGDIPAHDVFTREIEKSDPDDRQYRIVRLENGIQAILVHDPAADKAAACLTIAVGSLYDPVSGLFLASVFKP